MHNLYLKRLHKRKTILANMFWPKFLKICGPWNIYSRKTHLHLILDQDTKFETSGFDSLQGLLWEGGQLKNMFLANFFETLEFKKIFFTSKRYI